MSSAEESTDSDRNNSLGATNVTTEVDKMTTEAELAAFRTAIMALAYIIGYASLVLGLVGNSLTVALFRSRRCMINASTQLMLLLLSCTDSAVLLVSLTRFISVTLYSFDIRLLALSLCRGHTFLTYVATDMSSWCLCLVCCERLLCVITPTLVKRAFTRHHVLVAYASLLAASGAKNLPLLLGLRLTDSQPHRCIGQDGSVPGSLDMRYFYLTDFFLRVALPALFVLVVNVVVQCRLFQFTRQRASVEASVGLRKELRVFRMLFMVSVYFFLSMLPGRALFLYTFINSVTGILRRQLDFVYNLLIIVAYTNHAINFYLYLASSNSIRVMLVAMLKGQRNHVNRVKPVTMVPGNNTMQLSGDHRAAAESGANGVR